MDKKSRKQMARQVRAEVHEQFQQLDAAAADAPGLDTLLRVYGRYEAAMKQVDSYFALLRPTARFTVSNTTSQPTAHADMV